MKVLYIHQYFTTPDGCSGTRSYEFAKQLIASGHEVTILCGSSQMTKTNISSAFVKGKRQGVVDNINIVEVDLNYSNYHGFLKRASKFVLFVFKCTKYVRSYQYDILVTTSTPLTVAIPGILMKMLKFKKRPFILEIRDLWPDLPQAMGVIKNPIILKALGTLEWLAYKYADFGIGLSPGICQGMKRYRSFKSDEVVLIPNGCDNTFFNNSKVQETSNITLNKLLENHKTAIFTGAHGIANGLEAVIDVAHLLLQKGRDDIKFLFIGDGKVKPTLINQAQTLGLDNCYFFDPIVKRDMPYVMKKATLGLMILQNVEAFYYGTSPNKFFDYIASGLPVVNNYPGWVANMIKEYDCGETCTPDSKMAFADAIVQIVDATDKSYSVMSTNARNLAREFDRGVLAQKFVKLCERAYSHSNNHSN